MQIDLDSYSQNTPQANCMRLDIGPMRIWFSYNTPVAFVAPGMSRVVRENSWGPTTGKHLRWIDGGSPEARKRRLPGEQFDRIFDSVVSKVFENVETDIEILMEKNGRIEKRSTIRKLRIRDERQAA